MKYILVFALLACAGALISQPAPPERVGPRSDGSVLLPNGWTLRPAGTQIPLSTFPMASTVSPDGRYLLILQGGYKKPTISVHSLPDLKEVSRKEFADAWLGMAFAPKSNLFYVSGGSESSVYEVELTASGILEDRRTFTLVAAADRKHTDFAGDIAISPDGRLIYVAALYRNSILVVNPQSGMVVEEYKTGLRPYRILFHPDGKSFFVTSWADGSLHHHDTISGKQIARQPLGPGLMDMVWSEKKVASEEGEPLPFAARLFITAANSNRVFVVGITAEKALRPIETINVALTPQQPAGMTPSSLGFSGDQNRLYVVCSDANAVAITDVSEARSRVLGFVPTGWYPIAARELPDQRLMVFNGRGPRSYPNAQGPNPMARPAPVHQGVVAVQYVGTIQNGSASVIDPADPEKLDEYTRTVRANSPYRDSLLQNAGVPAGSPLPSSPGAPTPIEHVVYIIKENRTYDQVLGDMKEGNGDRSLTLFGEEITPNHHKLAREFVLLDNFYVNADVSADGHNWSTAAIAPAYVQRMWPNSYAGRRKHYDYEGGEAAAIPPAGYLWTNVLAKGLSMRNYGWWGTDITPAPVQGQQVRSLKDPALAKVTSMTFRGFDMDYPDVERAKAFLQELALMEKDGTLPRLTLLKLSNDHTSGTAAGKISPRSAVADNDLAFGMVVEALSKSRFWPKMAIFVLEDDAQNGPDHVDSHRSPAYVLSPYTRGRGVDSSFYNTTSILRTIELLLGLQPMTSFDAAARPMFAAFRAKADLTPYVAEKNRYSLDERNAAAAVAAARSERFDFSEADRIDDDAMNEILWLAIKGTTPPVPVRSVFGR